MAQLTWVRGNSVLMAVTLTQIKTDGTEEQIDLSVYDAWACKVWRLSAYKKVDEEVTAALDQEGRVVLSLPSTMPCGTYSVEVTLEKESSGGATDNGTAKRRSYELPVFSIVESNGESGVTYDVVEGMLSADIEMRFQLLPIAETLGKNAYELWKVLPGNEGKTLQEYIDEVLDLNGITAECEAAIVIATHPDYIGEDNYVYHWTNGAYVKTDIYCKGDPGTGGEVDWDDITDKPTFATVATSGSYNDLSNKPTIPTEVTESTVAGWGFTKNTGTYSKPSGGIPKTDLASGVQTSLGKADTALQSFTETDPTVPSWAKASSKPAYTAAEVGAVPTTRTVNGKALSADITLSASDVSALPSSTVIPAAPGTLNTDNSTAQSVSSSEALSGAVKLHKVSKTGSYNDLLNKPTIPTVPTNVSAFTNDAGYLTSHQDISGKEDKMGIITVSATSLAPSVNKYYRFTADVGTLAVTLPTVTDTTKVASIVFYLTTGASPAVTFTSSHSVVYQDGFQLDASKTYEVNALFNGSAWVLMAAEISTT